MTMFIKLENGQPIGKPLIVDNMKFLFPMINWNTIISPSMIKELGFGLYDFSMKPNPVRYKKIVEGIPILNPSNEVYYQNWQYVDMTEEEKAESDLQQAKEIKEQRNYKLSLTDWTMLVDSPLSVENKQLYQEYRQQLRDISQQPGFPWDITWPQEP